MKNEKNNKITLQVFAVVHDWDYSTADRIDNGCEVVAIRCDEADAAAVREEAIQEILRKRTEQNYKYEVVRNVDLDADIYAQPSEKWYLNNVRDYIGMYPFDLPISREQLEQLIDQLPKEA